MTPPTPDAVLSQTWSGSVVAAATTAITSASFTPLGSTLLVVDASSQTTKLLPTAISGGGLTWTQQSTSTTNSPLTRWTATVPTAGVGAMTVAVTFHSTETTSARTACAIVEVWPYAQLVGTPHNITVADTASPFTDSITSVTTSAAGGSMLSCSYSDFDGKADLPTYTGSATTLERFTTLGIITLQAYYQVASSPASQAYGFTLPVTATIHLAAMELIEVLPDPVSTSLMLNQAVTRSNFY